MRLSELRPTITAGVVSVSLASVLLTSAAALAAPDLSGKVVLANMDRYPVLLRLGPARREIQPRKASVLSPKALPLTVEYWSGNTKAGWQKTADTSETTTSGTSADSTISIFD